MIYVGIDPGKSGGIAFLKRDTLDVYAMPDTDAQIWTIISALRGMDAVALVERVTGYVGDGGNPGSAMFVMGTNYGAVRMALTAAGVPYDHIQANVWQRELGVEKRHKGESKTAWKNRLKQRAQEVFPLAKLTLKTCDAALIAEYARLKTARASALTGSPPTAQSVKFGRTM